MNYLPYRDVESKTEPMNPLEQHLFQVIFGYPSRFEEDNKLQNAIEDKRRATAKEAAAVALKWIEKALRDTSEHTFTDSKGKLMRKVQDVYVAAWMEENGLKTPEV